GLTGCKGHDDVTGPGSTNANISGNVILGTSPSAARGPAALALAGVTVRVVSSSQMAMTDGNGDFLLTNVASGSVTLSFERADVHATGTVMAMAGATTQVTVSIVGNQAVIVHSGHVGEEIEGLIQNVDASGGKLIVLDQRLGSVN